MTTHLGQFTFETVCGESERGDKADEDINLVTCKKCLIQKRIYLHEALTVINKRLSDLNSASSEW